MILAFDTHYKEQGAKTVAVRFDHWTDEVPAHVYTEYVSQVAPYEPGFFYKRELPCILSLLKQVDLKSVQLIVVDGYVHLQEGKNGLGGYLYEELGQSIPIIGVAKSGFKNDAPWAKKVYRGESKKPLYVTAAGVDLEEAEHWIQNMHGQFRMPTLFQVLDTLTKED